MGPGRDGGQVGAFVINHRRRGGGEGGNGHSKDGDGGHLGGEHGDGGMVDGREIEVNKYRIEVWAGRMAIRVSGRGMGCRWGGYQFMVISERWEHSDQGEKS